MGSFSINSGVIVALLSAVIASVAGEPDYAVKVLASTKSREGRVLDHGTGVIVGDNLVLTNNHVVSGTESVSVSKGSSEFKSTIVAVDKEWDLALLKTDGLNYDPIQISRDDAFDRDGRYVVGGYGPGPDRKWKQSEVAFHEMAGLPGRSEYHFVVLKGYAVRNGDSGGPIVNRNGELSGIIFGADRMTHGVTLQPIKRILTRFRK